MRREGAAVELALGLPLKRALRNADRAGATSVHLIGTDELRRGAVKVRDLATGEERERPLREPEGGEPVPSRP
jgi:histidyl-tRNA synthetase